MNPISSLIAYDPAFGYFDPNTLESIDDQTATGLVESEHAAGFAIAGIDAPSNALPPVSDAQNQVNLNAASAQAMTMVGLGPDKSTWVQQQAVDYINALRGLILASPQNFNAATLQIAQNVRIQPDLAQDVGNKLINPPQLMVYVTDVLDPVVAMIAPVASLPGTISHAAQSTLNAANAIVSAVDKSTSALSSTAGVAEILLPLAFVGFLFFAVKSVGSDPGGQAKKLITSFA